MIADKKFHTIKYYKANQLTNINSTPEATTLLKNSSPENNIAVLLSINSPVKIERAVNITKDGFTKIRELIPLN